MRIKKTLVKQYRLPFVWPGKHHEVYDPTLVYQVGSRPEHFHLGFGWREVHGSRRRRVIVFKENGDLWPAVEFEGVDDYACTARLIWPIKKPGGNKQYRLSEEPHEDYRRFEVRPFRELIDAKGAYRGWGLLVHEDDHDTILKAAVVRDRHRQREV